MQILLAFAPFVVFAIVDRLLGSSGPALLAGATVALLLLFREWMGKKQSPKLLDVGSALLFSGLFLYFVVAKPAWSVIAVRLYIDCGLLLIVLISLAVGRPFTIQYAREQVPTELWATPEFRKTNYVISGVWALAFGVMVLAELSILYAPQLLHRFGVVVIVLALASALKFTAWYPSRLRK